MPRQARLVVPGIPHHVVQRGNRRQHVFFEDVDYAYFLASLREYALLYDVDIHAFCLMPNHIHLVVVPQSEMGLGQCLARVHGRYTHYINKKMNWVGHLWQGRFSSSPMDDDHFLNCVRYVELNPVRAGLCEQAYQWPWSSACEHLQTHADCLCEPHELLDQIECWERYLNKTPSPAQLALFQKAEVSEAPLGSETFLHWLGHITGRELHPRKRGLQCNRA